MIVVGAGRSGTTMIREALRRHPLVAAIPFELNHLWRHGNRGVPHDFLTPEAHLTPRACAFIRGRLADIRAKQGTERLLDKTVANVARLRYVHAVLPDSKIVHVIRDGRAVAASAMVRWVAPQSTTRYGSGARFVPPGDLPVYAWRYMKGLIRSRLRGQRRRHTWGVRFPGMDIMVEQEPLARVCAAQWRWCVEAALEQKSQLSSGSYFEVRYESIMNSPVETFEEMQRFLDLPPAPEIERWARSTIEPQRQDRWRTRMDPADLEHIVKEAGPLLQRLKYL